METIVSRALTARGIVFVTEEDPRAKFLDFYLPEFDTHIEVKQFHADRVARQMARVENIVVIQGLGAAKAFETMLMNRSTDVAGT